MNQGSYSITNTQESRSKDNDKKKNKNGLLNLLHDALGGRSLGIILATGKIPLDISTK